MSIDPLPHILVRLRNAVRNDWSWPLTSVEADRIVTEIERLQAVEAQVDQIIRDHAAMLRAQGFPEERAAIVAFLRSLPDDYYTNTGMASAIERVEHRPKEEP